MKLHVIKIGGNVIDHKENLNHFTEELAGIKEPFVLIHGGGKLASGMSARLGIEPKLHEGRRITDAETLDVVTMVYAGLVNKRIVARLQFLGCNAIGLCGADANLMPARKREHPQIDFGFVGDPNPEMLNRDLLNLFLRSGLYPVIAPLTHDTQGNLLNTNADTIASCIAMSMAKEHEVYLHFCFEKAGVLRDVNQDDSIIPEITPGEYALLKKDGIISDGMIPKLDNAFAAINAGVKQVSILHALQIRSFIVENGHNGTRIYAQ